MSSTNRSNIAQYERAKDDFYRTPGHTTRAILPHLPMGGHILEPCAGDGAIVHELLWHGVASRSITAVEIDGKRGWMCPTVKRRTANFLKWVPRYIRQAREGNLETIGHLRTVPSLIVTNPPFSLAMPFAEKCLREAEHLRATVAFLLRLNWLGSRERKEFHRKFPADIYGLSRRPQFGLNKKGKKGSDSTEYAWYVWGPGRGGNWSLLDCEATEQTKLLEQSRLDAPRVFV